MAALYAAITFGFILMNDSAVVENIKDALKRCVSGVVCKLEKCSLIIGKGVQGVHVKLEFQLPDEVIVVSTQEIS